MWVTALLAGMTLALAIWVWALKRRIKELAPPAYGAPHHSTEHHSHGPIHPVVHAHHAHQPGTPDDESPASTEPDVNHPTVERNSDGIPVWSIE